MSNYVFVNGQMYDADVLAHHGIKGMKWGRRRWQNNDGSLTPAGVQRYSVTSRVRKGHAGPSVNIGAKRQLEGAKRDLDLLNKGGHLSYGSTKKRQEAYDNRDRNALEKKSSKLEAKEEYRRANKAVQDRYDREIAEIEKPYKRGQNLSKKDLERQAKLDEWARSEWAKNKAAYKNAKAQIKTEERKNLESKYIEKGMSKEEAAKAVERRIKVEKAAKVGAAVAGTVLAAYGAKKFHDYIRDENGKLALEAGRRAMREASNTTGVKGLYQLADQANADGRYARAMELERKAADIAVNYGLQTQKDMEKLNFAKAAANVYLNKRR